jgi:hypothetical protein
VLVSHGLDFSCFKSLILLKGREEHELDEEERRQVYQNNQEIEEGDSQAQTSSYEEQVRNNIEVVKTNDHPHYEL